MDPYDYFDEEELINDDVAEGARLSNYVGVLDDISVLEYDSDDVMQAEAFKITVRELLRRRVKPHRPEWASDEEIMQEVEAERFLRQEMGIMDEDDEEEDEENDDEDDEDDDDDEEFYAIQKGQVAAAAVTTAANPKIAKFPTKRTMATPVTTNNPSVPSHVTTTSAASMNKRTTSEILRLPNKGDDIFYSFERYQGADEWGNNATVKDDDEDVMVVKQYKQANASSETTTAKTWLRNHHHHHRIMPVSSAATSAGAKLVEYLEQKQIARRTLTISTRGDDGVRSIPRAGEESAPMTLGNGTRVHVRISKPPTTIQEQSTSSSSSSSRNNILGVPMSELWRRSEALQKASIASRCRVESQQKNNESMMDEEEEDDDEEKTSQKNQNNYLWVDKHAPTSFSHLLSDESINREVLRALRAWDPYVFHRAAPRQRQYGNANPPTDDSNKKSNDVRPDERNRVILLSGPPGVGKTTLAHILAKHAGYRPMEVNASDERSAAVLKERVLQAMESTTLQFSSSDTTKNTMVGRPNCLILDEIDGADVKGAIATLVEIIRAEIPSKSSSNNSAASTTKANKQKKSFLRRPMIFICNHKYAPALRPLLPYCRHFDVSPPSSVRLVARLRAILAAENLTVGGSSNMLNQLVVSSGGDIRSCLYTLQFASARAKELSTTDGTCVDLAPVLAGAVGGSAVKDERNDVASIITCIFRKWKETKHEERNMIGNNNKKSYSTSKASVDRVMDLVKSFDDHTKTLDGMFMNVMRVSYIDPTLDRCAAAHEWMSGADMFRSWRMTSADGGYTMQSWHIPSSAAAIHLMCRVETRSDLTFSTRELSDLYYQHEANVGLTQRFLDGSSIKARGNMRTASLVTETIPYALWMLSAGEGGSSLSRTSSTVERLSAGELEAFHTHVSTLLSLGLKYVVADDSASETTAFRSVAASIQLRLDPPIDKLVRFAELSVAPCFERKPIPASLKELLAQHSVQEGLRDRAVADTSVVNTQEVCLITQPLPAPSHTSEKENLPEVVVGSVTAPFEIPPKSESSIKVKQSYPPGPEPAPKRAKTLNFLGAGAAKVKAARTAKRVAKAGFLNTQSTTTKLSHTGSGVPLHLVIRFKYQKGFTQAVRTPCRCDDLLG